MVSTVIQSLIWFIIAHIAKDKAAVQLWPEPLNNSPISDMLLIRTINIHLLINFMIKMMNLIDVIPYM